MRGAARYLREAYSLYEVVSEPRIGVYTFQLSCTLLVLPNMPHILTIQNQLHPQICAQAHCRSAKALLRTSASCFLPRQACWGSRLRGVRQSTAYAQQSPDFQSPDSSGRRTLQVAFTCDKRAYGATRESTCMGDRACILTMRRLQSVAPTKGQSGHDRGSPLQ
ncbi:hypothetical protein ABBQ38_000782 [Trebouxia sp. C0009 RCD-2024]